MVTSIYWSTPLVRVSVDAIVTLVSLDHPWLPVYTGLPLVRVSVDAIVTLVSLDHPWLPVYTGQPPCQGIRGCQSYSGIPGPSMVTSIYWSTPCQSIRGCHSYSGIPGPSMVTSIYWSTPCQSIRGCHSYSGIPGPSMVTSVYWSTPLVRVSVDARVTLVSQDHPWLPVYTGLPPCQSIRGLHSYSGIPGPSMVTSIYWSTPLSEYPWMP